VRYRIDTIYIKVILTIVLIWIVVGSFLLYNRCTPSSSSKATIVTEKGEVLKAVEQDLLKHGKIGKIK